MPMRPFSCATETYSAPHPRCERAFVIALVADHSIIGGGERALYDLATGLGRQTAMTPIVLCRQPGPLVNDLRDAAVATTIIPFPNRFRRGPWPVLSPTALAQVARWMRRSRVGLVHTNGPFGLLAAGAVARAMGLPVVHTCHLPDDLSSAGKRLLLRAVPHRLLAVTDGLARRLRDRLGLDERRVRHLPLGIDGACPPGAAEAGDALRRRHGWSPEQVVFAQVARWQPVKGQDRFLSALEILCRRRADVCAAVVGPPAATGSPEAAWRQTILDRIDRSSILAEGRVIVAEGNDAPAWLSAANGLVAPSDAESFGRVILEAMAQGRPVIATPCDGPREILDDGVTGWIAPTWDPADLAAAMERLAGDRDAARAMGRRAAAVCAHRFSLEGHVAETARLYAELAEIEQAKPGETD